MALMPVQEARRQILSELPEPPVIETTVLADCPGRVLASPLTAQRDVPPFDNSAMDGYAVRHSDLPGPLAISQRVPAGSPAEPLAEGTAARIFTGAVLPEGADTVLIQENARDDAAGLTALEIPEPGSNIRRRGGDITCGEVILPAGQPLSPQDIGLAASVGCTELSTYRPLRVAVITTGDELVEPGDNPQPWQIFNSNGVQLCAQIRALGMHPERFPNVPDNPDQIGATLETAARISDCIVTSGGVSVGEEDHVRHQIESRGALRLWKLALKPGKPLAFGEVAGCPVFGLPGNPVSSWVTFGLLVKPWLLAAQGAEVPPMRRLPARAGFSVSRAGQREEYLRVVLDDGAIPTASLSGDQSSGVLSAAGRANALAVLPAGTTVAPGDSISVVLISEFLSPAAAG